MKNSYASLLLICILLFHTKTKANCPANSAPSNIISSSVCKNGNSIFSATLNDITNTLVWLDSANRIIGSGNNFEKYIDRPNTIFKAAEVGYDGITQSVGPLYSQFNTTYPSQNFTNGQFFNIMNTIRIDSLSLRSNNPLSGSILIWNAAPENGGIVLQRIPFNITVNGPSNSRIGIGAILTSGNYFMNVEISGGTGVLYRAIDGATYPYTINNLISITGTNFIGDPDRYYYFFDWKVSKMCMSPMSASFSPNIIPTLPNKLPYTESFDNGIHCDWSNTAPSNAAKWSTIKPSSNPLFPISPLDTSLIVSNDIDCKCDKSSVLLESPWFDLREYSKETTVKLALNYIYRANKNSKVYIYARNASNSIVIKDSLPEKLNPSTYIEFNLRKLILSDSVKISIEHRDNGYDSSAVAIYGLGIFASCSTSTNATLILNTDSYASEISWEIRDAQTRELIVQSLPLQDLQAFDSTKALSINQFCLIDHKKYIFKIKDSFGDGLDDGTHIGNYTLKGLCGDTILHGSGAFPYGGQVLPEMAWDSVEFIAGQGYIVDIGPDITLNYEDTLILDAGANWKSHLWNTGDTTRTLTIIAKNYLPGKYTINVSTSKAGSLCTSRDTIQLEILGNYNPLITVGVITDSKGSEIKWELRDKNTDTIIFARGPFADVIPYHINMATHIDTIRVEYGQELSFKVIDLAGNGLYDGVNQGKVWVGNNCVPEIFLNESINFPNVNAGTSYDSLVFKSNAKPILTLGADFQFCDGDSALLVVNGSANDYFWSNGDRGKSITVYAKDLLIGDNVLSVNTTLGICFATDTIVIKKLARPNATFSNTINGATLNCQGNVTGQTYEWNFGDGSTATGRIVTHTYAANGNYTITYKINGVNGCSNQSTKNISITGVGIAQQEKSEITIFPNPSSGIFNINFGDENISSVEVYDMQGRKVYEQKIAQKKEVAIDLSSLVAGVYVIKVGGEVIFTINIK